MSEFDPQYQHDKVPSPSEVSPVDPNTLIDKLRKANAASVARTAPLLKMLGQCRQQFSLYGEHHRAKGTDEANQKAEVNEGLVRQIDTTLADFRKREDPTEETPE